MSNFCYLKIIHVFHARYHPKIIGHTYSKKQAKSNYDVGYMYFKDSISKAKSFMITLTETWELWKRLIKYPFSKTKWS